jgi:hypothetical protein
LAGLQTNIIFVKKGVLTWRAACSDAATIYGGNKLKILFISSTLGNELFIIIERIFGATMEYDMSVDVQNLHIAPSQSNWVCGVPTTTPFQCICTHISGIYGPYCQEKCTFAIQLISQHILPNVGHLLS